MRGRIMEIMKMTLKLKRMPQVVVSLHMTYFKKEFLENFRSLKSLKRKGMKF
jgi:hypothetical protein